jgi:helicase
MIKEKEEIPSLEDYITFKKTHLLYDWVEGKKSVKTIEEEYDLYRGCIYRLGEGFSWLADSLVAIAESVDWEEKYSKDLNKIKMLSNRLVEGVQEEGINLALLYMPGLSRHYIGRLEGAGYRDENSLRDASEGELGKLIPKRLVQRIQKKMKEDNNHLKMLKLKWIVQGENCEPVILPSPLKITDTTSAFHNLQPVSASSPSKTENCKPTFATILEIDQHRPDRIIFMGKKIELTSTEFSLIHLLALHNGRVMSYDELLDEFWKDEEDAIYNRVSFHISKIRRTILKTIGKRKRNEEKVKDIFVVVPKRGVILKLKAEEIKIN